MSVTNQPQSLTLDGHTIDCSRPISDGCKNVFHAWDDQKMQVVAKRIFTDDPT